MARKSVKQGKLLLAEPFMMDPNFKRSVILVCDHSKEQGSIGFILNKPLKMNIDELVGEFPEFDSEVHYGGPVSTDTIHYVHNVGELLEDSVSVGRGIYWGGNFEKLKFLIESKLIKPQNVKFFVGYSGWTMGQLKEELKTGSWVMADMDPNYIFKTKARKLWQDIMVNKGDIYSVIAQMPEGPNLN
jgi:putative transcriptional regulator